MDRMTDEPDVIIEEYEEVIGNFDEPSDERESGDAEADSIQEPTSMERRILTTHTGRPSLRSTNARLAGSQAESKPVVVTQHVPRCWERQSDGSEYKKTLRRPGLRPGPR